MTAVAELELEQILERLPLAVDRVMGESGLWAPELAARALRQARGDIPAAVQLLRAHKQRLPRVAYSAPAQPAELRVTRRISSAFREPPGGQVLGRTMDYVGRLLDLLPEEEGRTLGGQSEYEPPAYGHGHGHGHEEPRRVERTPDNLLAVLRGMGVVDPVPEQAGDPEPFDITRKPVVDDVPRSAWLQLMAKADTGALMHLWYRFFRGGGGHEIPGEIRHGSLPVQVKHPYAEGSVTVAEVRVSEVQTFHSLGRPGELGAGYGLCLGTNDRKAISMAGLDLRLLHHRDDPEVQQEVVSTLDGGDFTGYLQHLKLPHHVEFRSVAERAHTIAERAAGTGRRTEGMT
jgi:alpha-D-ribose 1-methylphosphonate 5-triphosphate synthase subunit PhnI